MATTQNFMKRTITTVLFFAVCGLHHFALAQSPVLTASNSTMQPGESFTGHRITYLEPGNGGADQTWDFSGVASLGTSTFSCVTPASTPRAADFPASTVATGQSSIYNYYTGTSSELQIDGYAYPTMVIPMSDPEKVLTYPFSYNSTFTDAFAATYTSGTNTIRRSGTVTVMADGYGTLKLPNGTLNNVLRVKTVESYADSIGSAQNSQATTTTYSWYLPGMHYAVLALSTVSFNGTIVNRSGQYLDNSTSVIEQSVMTAPGAEVYPNPCSSYVTISVPTYLTNATISIYTIQGQRVREMENVNGNIITIQTNNLPIGQYDIRGTQGGKTVLTKKVLLVD